VKAPASPRSEARRIGAAEWLAWFAAALALRWLVAALTGFDGAYGQDAWGYIERADRALAGGLALRPLHDSYTMPIGFPYAAAALAAIVGSTTLAAQLVALFSGAIAAPLCGAIVQTLTPGAGRTGPRVAAAAALLSGQHITWSIAAMSDAPAAAACLLAILAMAGAWDAEKPGSWLAVAGAALGACWITRWSYVAVAPGFAAAWLWLILRRRIKARAAFVPVLTGAAVCALQLVVTMGHSRGLGLTWSTDWSPAAVFMRRFEFAEGLRAYTLPQGVYWTLPGLHPTWISPLLGLLAVVAVALLWRQRQARGRFAVALLAGAAAGSWLVLSGMPQQTFRYGMQIWVGVVPLAGIGAGLLMRRGRRGRRVAISAVALSVPLMLLWTVRAPTQLVAHAHGRRDAALALLERIPPDAALFTLGPTSEIRHRTTRPVHELYFATPADLQQAARAGPVYLIYAPGQASRWRSGPMAANLGWVKARRGRSVVALEPPWQLVRVPAARGDMEPGS